MKSRKVKTRWAVALMVPFWLAAAGCGPRPLAMRPDGTPGPEECPKESLQAMAATMLYIGDTTVVWLDHAHAEDGPPIAVRDGRIESVTKGPMGTLGPGTHLVGKVWTSGPQAVIRYYEAISHTVGPVPVCMMARTGGGMLQKSPDSAPGTAMLQTRIGIVFVVDAFR